MNQLSVSRQGERVSADELRLIPYPESTGTYQTLPHHILAEMVKQIGHDILTGFSFYKEEYGLARDGKQLFAVHTYKNSNAEMGLSIGFRNSYDRSLSVGITIGASVFICDNLMFVGEIKAFRKHTSNLLQDIKQMILATIYSQKEKYSRLENDAARLKRIAVSDDIAFKVMGVLFGKNIITPRQLPVLKKEWLEPSYEAFKERNAWSLYNAATEALKTTPPHQRMEKQIQLHNLMVA
jgi:hypothetical protein